MAVVQIIPEAVAAWPQSPSRPLVTQIDCEGRQSILAHLAGQEKILNLAVQNAQHLGHRLSFAPASNVGRTSSRHRRERNHPPRNGRKAHLRRSDRADLHRYPRTASPTNSLGLFPVGDWLDWSRHKLGRVRMRFLPIPAGKPVLANAQESPVAIITARRGLPSRSAATTVWNAFCYFLPAAHHRSWRRGKRTSVVHGQRCCAAAVASPSGATMGGIGPS